MSATAISLCPGLEEVNLFGGSPHDLDINQPWKDDPRISETTTLTFGELIVLGYNNRVALSLHGDETNNRAAKCQSMCELLYN